jgi:hypothetical protein
MLARRIADIASPSEAATRRRIESQPYGGGFDGEAELIGTQLYLGRDVDIVLAALGDETLAFGAEQFRGLPESQAREQVEQRQLGARLGQHAIWEFMRIESSFWRKDICNFATDGFHQ